MWVRMLRGKGDFMLVRDLMMPTVLTPSPSDPVAEIVLALREVDQVAAIVTDGEEVVGLLTEKELANPSEGALVKDVMLADFAVIAPGATLADAAQAMTEKSQPFLPVVEAGFLIGILSLTDVSRWAHSGQEGEHHEVQKVLKLSVRGYESGGSGT
jgi:CBS domain-containing protein